MLTDSPLTHNGGGVSEITKKKMKTAKQEIIDELKSKGFSVEEDKEGIHFSLTHIGLSCVWARIPNEEINIYQDQLDDDNEE